MGLNYVRSGIISLISGLIALVMLFAWSGYRLESQTRSRLMVSGAYTEKIVEQVQQVSRRAFRFYGLPCTPELRSRLQRIVMETPHMRVIELVSASKIYCSSVFSHGREGNEDAAPSGERMLLVGETTSSKETPALRIREDSALRPLSVLAEIDGYYISEILSNAQVYPPAFFQAGKRVLTLDNRVTEMHLPAGLERYTITFPRAGFEIHYVISNHVRLSYLWLEYRWGVLSCILLMLVIFLFLSRVRLLPVTPQYALENALNKKEFVPYIQPVVCADTGEVVGGEILLRWQHPGEGIIPPDQFIPLAESSGLIIDITCEMLRAVRECLVPAVATGRLPRGFHLGVNISPQHLARKDLILHCTSFLRAFPENSLTLVLEITEREQYYNNRERTLENFNDLKAFGIKFALDDFGTGYSTYTWLQQFSVDFLKIDKSFVQMIGSDNISGDIVENVIMLSHKLNIKTIAEGVENDSQSRYLTDHGVQYLQGYLYGRPIPLADFINDFTKEVS
ncbi:EAL domain-containing protein [Salmonella enterica subsp. enterica]|nr:EAL domain-containing protein [Salmonella enterica subsp. enterica]